ncbi:hypothetical protein AT302_21495 [Pandoraea norimbergensis]|uniref:Uncharacterized protein n=1 Tax=Pandoraea norimbergensis TaxID=93219 RepID=A0ABM5WN77_9BURK|nr:hypothetical protein AT302_21495 [Pandoraea norimbergensis]
MGKPRQSCIAASRSATMDRCEGLRGVCADFTGLEPKFDSDLVGLTPDAFFAAAQDLEHQIRGKAVGDGPLGDRDAFGLKLGAGFISST